MGRYFGKYTFKVLLVVAVVAVDVVVAAAEEVVAVEVVVAAAEEVVAAEEEVVAAAVEVVAAVDEQRYKYLYHPITATCRLLSRYALSRVKICYKMATIPSRLRKCCDPCSKRRLLRKH
jgi:hypothetical protein